MATAGFVRVESRRPEPLMDLRLFRRPVYSGAVVGAVAVFIALNMTLLLNTVYLQHARQGTGLPAPGGALIMAVGTPVSTSVRRIHLASSALNWAPTRRARLDSHSQIRNTTTPAREPYRRW